MKAFDLLHPALQHHIVNSLNWRNLKPLQEQSIKAILSGKHMVMLAPTAGGKTEAALFPLFSRMLFENWSGLSLLYICPLKALLNNLNVRVRGYATLLGRRSEVWHGDTKDADRKAILADPPDCLLTTPESVEAILISTRSDHMVFFENLHAVVVDEIHALAGDDRGWHLLAILERLTKIANREIQRIGLSATVGNPDSIVDWLSKHCIGERAILLPAPEKCADVDVKLDFVGNLENAAIVIARLHRGEKRLVFCDSRSRVEQLAHKLRGYGIKTYVSHSSLSVNERRQAEHAFSNERDCVIVATSALELGIDVGDLDRVIQIDAPATVSSFLQRLGRTGRREGIKKNCIFLATSEQALLQAAGLIHLWSSGYVEPVTPPPAPYHVFVQQILSLLLQEKGIGLKTWQKWVGRVPAFEKMPDETVRRIFNYMLAAGIITEDQGIIWFGPLGEKLYGFRNFMNLCSIFTSPPLFMVRYGKNVIGYVDEITFAGNVEQVLLLGGRAWKVRHIDRDKKMAHVEPTTLHGKSRWLGAGPFWSTELCQSVKLLLVGQEAMNEWSRRATEKITNLRLIFNWVGGDSTTICHSKNNYTWWTFAGKLININLSALIYKILGIRAFGDNLSIKLDKSLSNSDIKKLIRTKVHDISTEIIHLIFEKEIKHYKFHECLPDEVILQMEKNRYIVDTQVKDLLKMKVTHSNMEMS